MTRLIRFYLSVFGLGYSPIAPGTLGSLAVLPLIYFFPLYQLSIITILLTIISYLLINTLYRNSTNEPLDPSWVIQDEVSGQLIAGIIFIIIYESIDIKYLVAVFIAFRFFDIKKPSLVGYLDRLHTPNSIINDDIVAGFLAGLLISLLKFISTLLIQ